MRSKMCDENLTQTPLEMERNQIGLGKLLRKLKKTKICLKHCRKFNQQSKRQTRKITPEFREVEVFSYSFQ